MRVLLEYLTISTNARCYFVFQQDSALVNSAHNTVQLLQRETLSVLSREL